MMSPRRRVLSSTVGLPTIGTVLGTRAVTLELSCKHIVGITMLPSPRSLAYVAPEVWPCPLCNEVPDVRANDFLDGEPITSIAVAK